MENIKRTIATVASLAMACMMFTNVSAKEYYVPDIDSDFKSYMDYRCITDTRSDQYKLQRDAFTDDNGLRMIDDYYCVALGTYYSDTIGDCFLITLDTGESFKVIVGDIKDDRHTDKSNRYCDMGNGKGNIVEFIVDTRYLDDYARRMGTISAIDGFEGNIETIEAIDFE